MNLFQSLFRKVYTFRNGMECEEVRLVSEGGFAYVYLMKCTS